MKAAHNDSNASQNHELDFTTMSCFLLRLSYAYQTLVLDAKEAEPSGIEVIYVAIGWERSLLRRRERFAL
jgi:hypothetical protein